MRLYSQIIFLLLDVNVLQTREQTFIISVHSTMVKVGHAGSRKCSLGHAVLYDDIYVYFCIKDLCSCSEGILREAISFNLIVKQPKCGHYPKCFGASFLKELYI